MTGRGPLAGGFGCPELPRCPRPRTPARRRARAAIGHASPGRSPGDDPEPHGLRAGAQRLSRHRAFDTSRVVASRRGCPALRDRPRHPGRGRTAAPRAGTTGRRPRAGDDHGPHVAIGGVGSRCAAPDRRTGTPRRRPAAARRATAPRRRCLRSRSRSRELLVPGRRRGPRAAAGPAPGAAARGPRPVPIRLSAPSHTRMTWGFSPADAARGPSDGRPDEAPEPAGRRSAAPINTGVSRRGVRMHACSGGTVLSALPRPAVLGRRP
ncbi:MAG: hypothetical protein QOC93_1288 [Actinomycetota bacterium]|nr:hypothetical protein [Actinomycetota bacterium]